MPLPKNQGLVRLAGVQPVMSDLGLLLIFSISQKEDYEQDTCFIGPLVAPKNKPTTLQLVSYSFDLRQ